MSDGKKSIKERLIEETKSYLLIWAYLAVFLAAFVNYRRLVLREYRVGYFEFGFAVIEALILAKLILIGKMLHLGERFEKKPLIIPTLYKTLCFGILVVVFGILEHVVAGLWHGENAQAIIDRIVSPGKWEILARMLVMVTALGPLFATWEIGSYLGEGRLFRLFFEGEEPAAPQKVGKSGEKERASVS